jgi:hypothetical protein
MNVAQHWRLNAQRYRMTAQTTSAGELTFPPRPDVAQRAETRYVFVEEAADSSSNKFVTEALESAEVV